MKLTELLTTKEQLFSTKMQFKIAVSDPTKTNFSLDKANADFSHNQTILNALIGTLVKYGLSGKLEPYLAESWSVSSDKKNWKFTIRPNLHCEDGTLITAELFEETLKASLKEYSKRGSVITFDHLVGWEDFQKGKSMELPGIKTQGNILELNFNENPDDLLELLRMPYFGMWKQQGSKLISSGPYTLKMVEQGKVTLSLRPDWFTTSKDSFKEVEISFTGLSDQDHVALPYTITRIPFFVNSQDSKKDGYWISSPPTKLEAFVLSPYKKNFFNDQNNRVAFRNKVASLPSTLVNSRFFYPSARTANLEQKNASYTNKEAAKKLTFALERATYSALELNNLNTIISSALEGSGVQFEIIARDLADKDWFKKTDSNDFFDARVASVDVGAYPIYTAINMMFCTKLGINFPDSSSKICELVQTGIKSASPIDQNFVDKFNTILHEDAVIIPLHHHSDKWLVSNTFDPSSLPATTLYPQFELVRLR